jgi:hypothetical protein
MTDADLLTAAIAAATDGNVSAFARLFGYRDGSRVFAWRAGQRVLPPDVRRFCAVIVAHPEVALWLGEIR